MKKITYLLVLLVTLFFVSLSFGQKAVVIGTTHSGTDSFSFLVTEPIANGEFVYFTDDEYNNSTNVFSSGESVVRFVASSALTVGTVVRVQEGASNVLAVTCTGGGSCGTATVLIGFFSLRTDGEAYYSYSDSDGDPTNGVTEIYSVFFTGEVGQPSPGGPIPALLDPTGDFPNSILLDGFPAASPNRAEYAFVGTSRDNKCRIDLESVGNYLHAQAFQALSTTVFTGFMLPCTSPSMSVTRTPASVVENSGSSITYTFTLGIAAPSPVTVNFSVGGTATFPSDYGQSGAASFGAASGTVVIGTGNTTANVTITPSGDTTLEPDETVILTATAGTGYTVGSPSAGTGTITNDDTLSITPVVAVTGTVHLGTEGFSFVALDDITAGTVVYFTENPFNNNLLAFSGAEAVVSWTAPGGGVLRGEVIVATETAPNTFTATCNSGTCGTVALVSGNFDLASNGEAFYAYTDSDTNHTNGITAISAVLFTGTSATPGGNIPAGEDPSGVYIGSVLVDGFPATPPVRTEYDPALRGVTVDQANFQNTSNWLHAQATATLSTVPFANIIIATGSANPTATLTVAPMSVAEDSGTGMVYTFMLDAPAVGNITINFTVAGTATLTTDYTQTGAATFTASTGTAVILNGNNSVAVTVTPVIDTTVEPAETVELMLASGTGYDGGSPNSATGTITNDDTSNSDPLVAVMGMAHDGASPDGFSFVAAKDILASAVVYFTEDEFDNTTLLFSSGESVLQWTSPAGGQIDAGDVIVVTETSPDVFTVTCSDTAGNGCGTIAVIVGGFALATNGETLYAYEDSDTDPTNGVDDIYAVMYTGNSTTPGGNLPAIEDPTGIYLSALVVDGFPALAPNKTEYTPAGRAIPVGMADFENPANYDHAFAYGAGLSTVPFANLNIVDTTPPVITCPLDVTVECGDDTSPANTGTATATDNVDPNPIVTFADTSVAGCGLTEVITRTWTATDDAGNSASCIQTITVEDKTQPVIGCPTDVTVECGDPTDPGSTGTATATDGCGTVAISFTDSSVAGCGLTETITRTWTATDECGNSLSCDQIITVVDTNDPIVSCPTDVTVECGNPTDPGSTGTATGTDGCGTVAITYTDSSVAGCGLTETITRTWTATDECGNSLSCDQIITVVDTNDPIVSCPTDVTVECGNPTDPGSTGTATGTDGCGTVAITYTDSSAAGCGLTETITRTWTVTDECGNTTSCDQIITVVDTDDPIVSCPTDVTVECGDPTDPGSTGTATGTDGCGTVTISYTDSSAAGCGLTETITRTWTATDECGNSSSCDQIITVVDTTDPMIACPADIMVDTDAGVCEATVIYAAPVGTDACGVVTISQIAGFASGSTFPVGTTTNTFEATDACGNTATCSFTVTVADNDPPVANCVAPFTIELDANGVASITVVDIDDGSTDNCGIDTLVASPTTFDCDDIGSPVAVTLTVTDTSGNISTCVTTVTVEDNIAPGLTVITSPIILSPPNHSYQTITLAELFVSVSDNCTNLSIDDVFISRVTSDEDENGPADGNTVDDIVIAPDCESVQLRKERRANSNGRVYTIYMTVDDGNGNTTTASAQVHVPRNNNTPVIADGVLYEEFCGTGLGPIGIPLEEETDGLLDIEDFNILAVDVKFWPNPSDGYFNLKLTSENNSERVTIQVYDPSNKLVHSGEFDMRDEYRFGSKLAAGVYIVTITQAGEKRSVRAVKY